MSAMSCNSIRIDTAGPEMNEEELDELIAAIDAQSPYPPLTSEPAAMVAPHSNAPIPQFVDEQNQLLNAPPEPPQDDNNRNLLTDEIIWGDVGQTVGLDGSEVYVGQTDGLFGQELLDDLSDLITFQNEFDLTL